MHCTRVPVCLALLLLLVSTVSSQYYACYGKNDAAAEWPSEAELRAFGDTIEGDIYLPGSKEWENATVMYDLIYNSYFGAVVYPETAADVQKAILFARDHDIRPTISSTTHDYIGRSSGDFTFQISLRRMRQLEVNENDNQSPTGASMKVGTGNTWLDVYEEVDKYGLIAVGGSAHTVSPGGYTLGGGHSPVTRMLGLGVDSVLEFTMVTADGRMVTVDEFGGTITHLDGTTEPLNDNGDLWWSVLGGGGGTYGVVTQFKFKLHQPPADGFIKMLAIFIIHKDNEDCVGVATEALRRFYARLGSDLSNNWGGYVLVNNVSPEDPYAGTYLGTVTFFLNHWGGDMAAAQADMRELTDFRPDCQLAPAEFTHYDTFLGYARTTNDEIYVRSFLVNRLIQPDDLAEDGGLADLMTSIEHVNVDYLVCNCIMNGGASETYPDESRSVNPALRTARCALSCGAGWEHEKHDARSAEAMMDFYEEFSEYGTGVYYNEPSYFLDDWKTEYWGSMDRYNRLLRVKQLWDPDNLFWCHHCVGSDLVIYESWDTCPNPFLPDATYSASAGRAVPAVFCLALLFFLRLV